MPAMPAGLRLLLLGPVENRQQPGAERVAGDGIVEHARARRPGDVGQHDPGLAQEQLLGRHIGRDRQGHGVSIGVAVVEVGPDEDEERGSGSGIMATQSRMLTVSECPDLAPNHAWRVMYRGNTTRSSKARSFPPSGFPSPAESFKAGNGAFPSSPGRHGASGADRRPDAWHGAFQLEPDERRRAQRTEDKDARRSSETAPAEQLDGGITPVGCEIELDRLDEPREVGHAKDPLAIVLAEIGQDLAVCRVEEGEGAAAERLEPLPQRDRPPHPVQQRGGLAKLGPRR